MYSSALSVFAEGMAHDPDIDTISDNGLARAGRSRAWNPTRLPPHVFFIISAVFHYLGPACAVLLFAALPPLGVAWLRIATAAVILVLWRRPWRYAGGLTRGERYLIVALGGVLAAMNMCFYIAISRLPLGTVGAIEFLGPIALAAAGLRNGRNLTALLLAGLGVALLSSLRLVAEPIGYVFAFANCALFVLYVVLGHRLAAAGGGTGVDRLALAMAIAMLTGLPIGFTDAVPAFFSLPLFASAVAVGLMSSVIPYICDQWAMARLPRATFALFLALLPAVAVIMGIAILQQLPSALEIAGVLLVIAGVALHRPV